MSTQITNYQCPACTGPLRYDGQTEKLQCDYCESSFTIEEIEALFAEKNAQADENPQAEELAPKPETSEWGDEAEKMRAYN